MNRMNMNKNEKDEHSIAHARREWTQGKVKAENSWTMFKVLSEFVEGFESLSEISHHIFKICKGASIKDVKIFVILYLDFCDTF